jgi:hypothetical protein
MESIPGNFNVHLAAIEAPGCTTTSAASRTVSLDCQVQASSHRFNDKLYTSPLAQREPSIDRQGTRCAAPCCQELVMLAKEVAGEWSWRYRQASGFSCADRNINPAPARKLQRDRQNILLRDVAICAHHVAQCHRGPCTTSARASRQPPPGRSSPGTRFRVERHEQACAPRRAGSVRPVPGFRNAQRAGFACIDRTVRSCAVRSGAARCQSGAPPCLVCIACFARILALLAPKTLFPCFREQFFML